MPTGPYRLSPYCVLIPGPDARSVTVIHSEYGSRFALEARFLAALLAGQETAQAAPPEKSAAGWTSAIAELVREKVLLDRRSYRRIVSRTPFRNRLGPLELAVLRGVNEGGMKAVTDGPPPPAMKPPISGRTRPLATHPPEGDLKDLADWLAARQSVRTYSSEPLARRQLEQFLQLTARAYASIEIPSLGTTSLRNYPSGGARYPLEIYPVLLNVRSFARGFYYYHPFHHRLECLGRKSRYSDALRQVVRMRMGRPADDRSEPAVLFLVTAVFPRTCWKYSGIPFQLMLQETGALYQTMYLAATAMKLAPCAVGAFPERAVGEILGLDPAEEAQVGLFALGVPAESLAARAPLAIERFAVRRGSPFSPDASRYSVELVFVGGQKETIDARDFRLMRSGRTLTCAVKRGRQHAVFTRKAEATIRRLMTERNGVVRCRLGRESVIVVT